MPRSSRVRDADAIYSPSGVPSYISGRHPRGFDPKLSTYNLDARHFRKLRGALQTAKTGAGICKVSWCGTSLVAGEGATPFKDNAPPVRLRSALATAGFAAAGTGLVLNRNGASGNDGRITASGTWSVQSSGIFDASTEDGAYKQFTSDLPGTVVDVLLRDSGTGQVKVTIDGVDVETITGTNSGAQALKSYTGLSDTTHVVRVTKIGTTAGPWVGGFCVRRATGLLVSSLGVGGSFAYDWDFSAAYAPRDVAVGYGADAFIYDVMTNDAGSNTYTPAQYRKWQRSNLTALRATSGTPDILLVADIPRGGGREDAAWRTVLYDLADEFDYPLVDLRHRWGSYTIANGLSMMSDSIHANAKGYADKGQALSSVLLAGIA